MGITPTSSCTASLPPTASESRRDNGPGNSSACAIRNPAPPAIKMAGNSSTPWGATKLHRGMLIWFSPHATPITPSITPLKKSR